MHNDNDMVVDITWIQVLVGSRHQVQPIPVTKYGICAWYSILSMISATRCWTAVTGSKTRSMSSGIWPCHCWALGSCALSAWSEASSLQGKVGFYGYEIRAFNRYSCIVTDNAPSYAGCLLHCYISVPRPGHSVLPRGDLGRRRKGVEFFIKPNWEYLAKPKVGLRSSFRHAKLLKQPVANRTMLGRWKL